MKFLRKIPFLVFLLTLSGVVEAQQYQSLLWEISSDKIKQPSYLFGTIHISDQRVFQFGDSVNIAFQSCSAMAGELKLDALNAKEIVDAIKMPGDTTLKMLLSRKDYKLVKKEVKKKQGFLFGLVINRIKPIYTSVLLEEESIGKGNKDALVLDQYFQEEAKKRGMKVLGLESAMEQLKAFEILSLQEQAAMLVESVKAVKTEERKDMPEKMIQTYLSQDLDSLNKYFIETEIPDNFMQSLLYSRNIVMADRMEGIMLKQPVFTAVGAAHLAGEQGIIELLRKKGYRVRPVFCKKN